MKGDKQAADGIHNHICDRPEERVIPFNCAVCVKCWLFVAGKRIGSCPYGGPFTGFYREGE